MRRLATAPALTSVEGVGRQLGLADAADQRLLAAAATRIAVPRESVPAGQISFILHAPAELLARGVLLSVIPAHGYPPGLTVDGIPLRDGLRLSRSLADGTRR